MVLAIDAAQPVCGYVRINLRGSDIGVAKNGLDGAQICAALNHMGSTTVPQHVWAGMPAGSCRGPLHHLPKPLSGEAFPAMANEQQRRCLVADQCWPTITQVRGNCLLRRRTERHDALFVAFAAHHNHTKLEL
ncbi:MAG TPA: hypothetical protein VKB56_00825 [Terriglobales bacterium]|nr:hypothetical protein [Terriglobales bacterium]